MLYLKIPLSRNLPDVSQTQEKGGGPSRQLSTKLYQCRCLPPRCTSDSVHAAMQISRTNCSRLCGSSSAVTWKNRPNKRGLMSNLSFKRISLFQGKRRTMQLLGVFGRINSSDARPVNRN